MKSIVYLFCFALFIFSTSSFSQETKVSINITSNGFQLIKNNEPYYIKVVYVLEFGLLKKEMDLIIMMSTM